MYKKFPILNDQEWLYEQYVLNKRSTINISKEIGCNCSLVRQACLNYGFEIRNYRNAQINKERDFVLNKSVLYGTLLGDSSLCISNKKSKIAQPFFRKRNLFAEHVLFCSQFLIKNAFSKIKTVNENSKFSKKNISTIISLSDDLLREFYDKWYPLPFRKKVIPQDMFIDQVVLLHWFLDDGWSHIRVRKECKNQKTKQVIVGFCSQSFSIEDNERLCVLMNEKFNLGAKIFPVKTGSGWSIKIPQSKTKLFFQIIGPPPITCLSYKWKWTEEELRFI